MGVWSSEPKDIFSLGSLPVGDLSHDPLENAEATSPFHLGGWEAAAIRCLFESSSLVAQDELNMIFGRDKLEVDAAGPVFVTVASNVGKGFVEGQLHLDYGRFIQRFACRSEKTSEAPPRLSVALQIAGDPKANP